MPTQTKLFAFFVTVFATLCVCVTEDILGCGGFIKSHANIDYSKVQVQLYTKSGNLKEETECAPNGYYFLPLYEKGEYILKVDPPPGWSFEPTQYIIDVDGTSDKCSQGQDVNFKFKGFGITGKVSSSGSNEGPAGVTVLLFKDENRKVKVDETKTSSGGIFSFTPIQPGKYVLTASHPRWIFLTNTIEVTVTEGNTELASNSLVVFGYDVIGKVTSDQEPIVGVSFFLSGNGKTENCDTNPVTTFEVNDHLRHVESDKNGRFVFTAVTNGEYTIFPYYAGNRTKFDIQPSELSFQVLHNSVVLPQPFNVTGFTVSGTVLMAPNVPLPNAKIFLSNKAVATTDANGRYSIDKMKSGQYIVKIDAPNVKFDEKTVKISPGAPQLPAMLPSSYKICGSVTLSTKGTHHRQVIVQNSKAYHKRVDTDPQTGQYCLYLEPGDYQMSVIVTADEEKKGLQFYPLQINIEVSRNPINDVNFLQLKATLTGEIVCLKDSKCNKVSVTLKVLNGITVKTTEAIDGHYEFSEVLPGHYEVLIDTDVFCWENPSHKISITSALAEVPVFKQTGFSVTFISSHDTAVEYLDVIKGKKEALTLPSGSTRHCISNSGEYKFVPKSCHVYPQESYNWDTNSLTPVILSAIEHRHRGKVISNAAVDDMKVKVDIRGDPHLIGPLKYLQNDNSYEYSFDFNANADTTYVITPLSEFVLFNPPSVKVLGDNDCNDGIATFTGELGKIVSGKISPEMEGVRIQIFGKDKSSPVHTLVTKKDGQYRVGPLDGSVEYTVTAEKPGFAISGPDTTGIIFAHKLAEIIVQVSDRNDDIPLQGVLLSLSGGESYRKNSITSEQGRLVFNSLSPGEYYLRAMMKEYRFDPPSQMISVSEGATFNIKLAGIKVALSFYGKVLSLNLEGEPGLVVEAKGKGLCSNHHEEATTDDTGNFRIKGLQPKCTYIVHLKLNQKENSHIAYVSPSNYSITPTEDTSGIVFIAVRDIARTDLSVRVHTDQLEHYRSLKIKLCREDAPDSPVHVAKIDPQQSNKFSSHSNPGFLLHFPPIQSNGKKYFVQLESSLSPSLYKYKTIPTYFEANSSFKSISMSFYAERKVDQGEMNQTSVLALPFIILVALAFMNREKLWYWFNVAVEQWSKAAPVSRTLPPVVPIDPRADDIIVEQIMNINKRKTKLRKT